MAYGKYKRYGRRTTTSRSYRRRYTSRNKKSYSRAQTIFKACGVNKSVWESLTLPERTQILMRKREGVAAAIRRSIALSEISGRRVPSDARNLLDRLENMTMDEIQQLANTDH